ncbi:hypothetical protein GCM10010182_74690 [Actinomadura cremea]|nr:hypothetical protein GCM10010182_74690 [Actinomadura cremea]
MSPGSTARTPTPARGRRDGDEASRHGHLPINGLSLYHEVYGELGESDTSPLLLIPGAFMATDSMSSWVAAFAGERTVRGPKDRPVSGESAPPSDLGLLDGS